MAGTTPRLTIQTASLYASGPTSTFTGSGGPFGYSPWTSQFGGVISSAGLITDPFSDAVYNVAAGDEVTLVIAVQNVQAAAAYGVRLHDLIPAGFVVPPEGVNLSVTDGAGNILTYSGDPLVAGGLTLSAPLAAYDPNSGANVALLTFTLSAGSAVPGPYASLVATAAIDGYSASLNGADLAAANPASAATTIVTAAPMPQVVAETDPGAVARGQTIAFDVSITIPAGTLSDFTITPVATPGASALDVVASTVTSIGNGLQSGATVVTQDGAIHFGTVSYDGGSGNSTITARIVVRASGTVSGNATLHTIISAASAASPGGRWSADVASSVGVVVPPPPVGLSGLNSLNGVNNGATVYPFATFVISGSVTQTATLAITVDSTVGRLGNPGIGTLDAAGDSFIASGSLSDLQAAARGLTYTASGTGTARLTVTVIDGSGGIAQDTSTTVATRPAPVPYHSPDPLFDGAYYLAHNPDVAAAGIDPYQHYMTFGWHEGRNPSALFDTKFYLTQNRDVAAAGFNPLSHFESVGWHEGRDPSLLFSDSAYLAHNQDVAGAGIDPLLHYTQFGQTEGRLSFLTGGTATADPLVDPAFYGQQVGATILPTGAAAAQQAAWSFAATGWQAGLSPDRLFDTKYYLAHNPDVAAAHINPLAHYEQVGWKEGRDPSAAFSTNKYLAAYSDVRGANLDPLLHYVAFGATEGRTAFAV